MPSHSDESFYMDGVRFGGGGDVGGEDAGGATSQPPPVHAPKRSPEHSGGVGDEGDEGDGGAAQLVREAKRSLPDDEDIAGPPKRRAAAVKARVMLKESLHPPPLPREKPPLREMAPLRGTKTMKAAAVDVSALCKALPRGRCNNCPPCLTAVIGKRRCVRSAASELGLPGALLTCLGHQAVGMLVAVAWKADNANYEAIVTRFDAATMKHDVTYCMDGAFAAAPIDGSLLR
jgi:hypothetical protein